MKKHEIKLLEPRKEHHLSDGSGNETFAHPLLRRLAKSSGPDPDADDGYTVRLQRKVFMVDTDLRKHEEGESFTPALYLHRRMAGLNLVSGAGHVDAHGLVGGSYFGGGSSGVTTVERSRCPCREPVRWRRLERR